MSEDTPANPLVVNIQQSLYPGTSGGPAEPGGAANGWWSFQFDPSSPKDMKMVVSLPGQGNTSSLSVYSSMMSVDEVQALYQWLATHMASMTSASTTG